MRSAERKEDMSQYGRLCVTQDNEGDMLVTVIPCIKQSPDLLMVTVEFCASGGKSPSTREALYKLMLAMQEDSERPPNANLKKSVFMTVDKTQKEADLSELSDLLLEMAQDYLRSKKEHGFALCNPDYLIRRLADEVKKYRDLSEQQSYALRAIEEIAICYTERTCGEVHESIDIINEINKVKNINTKTNIMN